MKQILKKTSFFMVVLLMTYGWASDTVLSEDVEQDFQTTQTEKVVETDTSFEASNLYGTEQLVHVQLRNYLGNKTVVPISFKGDYLIVEDPELTLQPDHEYHVKISSDGQLQLFDGSTNLKTFPSSFTIVPETYNQSHYMFIDRRAYLGEVEFTLSSHPFIRPINTLPLEDYLKGVVPHEMPAYWSIEALKVQAVAARGYALRRSGSVMNDTQSNQVYGGFKFINSNNHVQDVWHWRSTEAVNQTTGEVVLYGNSIAETVYSSSNGGVVESNNGAWGTTQLSYLVAKPDPYDPQHPWSFTLQQEQLTPGDLSNRDQWWETSTEQNSNLTNRLKQSISTLNSYVTADSFLIKSIKDVTFSNQTDGQRYRDASFDISFFVKDKDDLNKIELQGQTRWDTNQVITQYGWHDEEEVVIIGRGDQSADALTGNVLATKHNAPMLLTKNNELPEQIVAELTRLHPSKIYILGGPLAISEKLQLEIEQLASEAEITRIYGNNRYATSIEIAKEINSSSEAIILAPAYDGSGVKESPDALTVGSFAGGEQIPIILTEKDRLRNDIKDYIIENGINEVYLLGGHLVVSDEVENELRDLVPNVERIAGQTRYETATKIAERFPLNNSQVFFSRGDDHIDALAAAPLAARKQAPILLTRTSSVPPEVRAWLNDERDVIDDVYFLGGQLAIEDGTRETINDFIKYRYDLDGSIKEFQETVTITTGQLRTAVGGMNMRSTFIDSNKPSLVDGIYTVSGHGFGHGVGMSQYGANERAKAGYTYDEIIEFYYPNTTIGQR